MPPSSLKYFSTSLRIMPGLMRMESSTARRTASQADGPEASARHLAGAVAAPPDRIAALERTAAAITRPLRVSVC